MIMDFAFELKDELHRRGASLVGFADLKGISPEAGMPFGISIAYALDPNVISQISDGPTGEYAALYHRANEILGKLAEFAADFIASRGWKAKYIPATTNVSADRLATPLPPQDCSYKGRPRVDRQVRPFSDRAVWIGPAAGLRLDGDGPSQWRAGRKLPMR
jgi:hypothetical protein